MDKVIGMAIACSLVAAAGLPMILTKDVLLPSCASGTVPGVVSDSRVNGTLVHSWMTYAIRSADGNEHTLAECARASHCKGPYAILKQRTTGHPAHAEFCGPFLTLVSLNNVPVYIASPPTQSEIDKEAQWSRAAGRFCLWFLIAAALVSIGLFVSKNRRSR